MRSSRKIKSPRKAPVRPVLSFRVSQELYNRVRESAEAAPTYRSISEEAEWRLDQSYDWERAVGSVSEAEEKARKILREATDVATNVAGKLMEAELRRQGWKKVIGVNGEAWFSPGVKAIEWIFGNFSLESRAVLQEMLDRAAERAIQKTKETNS